MAIAKGTQSRLYWGVETAYGVGITSADRWRGISFSTESMDETINRIQSDDIRPERSMPAIRGGNITTGGQITGDFAPGRWATWFKHLLASGASEVVEDSIVPVEVPWGGAITRSSFYYAEFGSGDYGIYLCTVPGVAGVGTTGLDKVTLVQTTGTAEIQLVGTGTTSTAVVNKHTFKGGSTLPTGGLQITKKVAGQAAELWVAFRGCRLNTMELTVPQEGIGKVTWGVLASRSDIITETIDKPSGSVETPNDSPVSGYDLAIAYVANAVPYTVTPASAARMLRDFSFSLNNGYDESVFRMGSRYREELPAGVRTVTGRFTGYFIDSIDYLKFKTEAETPIYISMITGGRLFNIYLPKCKLTGSGTPKITGTGALTADFEYSAYQTTNTVPDVQFDIYDLNPTGIADAGDTVYYD